MARKITRKSLKLAVKRHLKGAPPGAACNEAIAAYTTTVLIPYGSTQPRAKCDPPTDEEEGDAMDKAKNAFKAAAAKYCAKGTCDNPSPGCSSTVTITSIENQGVVETADNGQKKCALKFKITGSVTCTCPPKPA